jgi:hypothetical protein
MLIGSPIWCVSCSGCCYTTAKACWRFADHIEAKDWWDDHRLGHEVVTTLDRIQHWRVFLSE